MKKNSGVELKDTLDPNKTAGGDAAAPKRNPDAVTAKKPDAVTAKVKKEAMESVAVIDKALKPKSEVKSTDAPAPKDPDFKTLRTVEELVAAYNDMVPTAIDLAVPKISTVRTFVDAKTGVLACERLHAAIKKARVPAAKAAAVVKEKKVMAKKSKKAKSKKGASKPRSKFDPKSRIVVVAKENPARKGTGRFARVQKVMDSKTVEACLKKVKAGSLAWCIANKVVKLA